MTRPESEVREGMRIDWDVPIEMDDGLVLRCDVYRPPDDEPAPVILSYGPYGKYLHFEDGYPDSWESMTTKHPDVAANSTNQFQSWEVVDPEMWVPDGYAVVRVDSRGAGRSPGFLNPFSAQEARDQAECIEWAAAQPWSTGKVGLCGISYYAMNQWQTASLQPEHLTAMVAWEGSADWYRELARHGGIYCRFAEDWFNKQVITVQHGVGERGYRSRMTGEWVAGPATLTEEELEANRVDYREDLLGNELATDEYWTSRKPDWSKVEVPFLSTANWGGQPLHPRGNFEAFREAASEQKWLEVHGREHWTEFYTTYGVELQKRFLGHFLKGEETGWADQPDVVLQVRHPGETFVEREETAWPIPRADWTKYYLHADGCAFAPTEPAESGSITYETLGDGVTFLTDRLEEPMEITGPIGARVHVSSETEDADIFVVMRIFNENLEEIVFEGAVDPNAPVAQGWLRASHRKIDPDRSEPHRPYHPHDEIQPIDPGEIYALDIEVWPTSIVVPEGHRIGVSIRGTDYEYPGSVDSGLGHMEGAFTGVGPYRHNVAADRPPEVFDTNVTIHTGPETPSHLLLPIIPERD